MYDRIKCAMVKQIILHLKTKKPLKIKDFLYQSANVLPNIINLFLNIPKNSEILLQTPIRFPPQQ